METNTDKKNVNNEDDWYKNYYRYKNYNDIISDTKLINFKKSKIALFDYIHLQESWYRRIPNSLGRRIRKLFNLPTGETIGLMNVHSKPEIIHLLNDICIEISRRARLKTPYPIVVTSILRTVEHQLHLKTLGYPAARESSHCCGYAADIENSWLRRNRPEWAKMLNEILQSYFDKGYINLIDYGNFYHICLNPNYLEHYKERSF